jgi:hypothetical protein
MGMAFETYISFVKYKFSFLGSFYMKSCPNSPGVPIILIINGSINLLLCTVESVKKNINTKSDIIPKFQHFITALKIASTFGFFVCKCLKTEVTQNKIKIYARFY